MNNLEGNIFDLKIFFNKWQFTRHLETHLVKSLSPGIGSVLFFFAIVPKFREDTTKHFSLQHKKFHISNAEFTFFCILQAS